MKETQRNDFDLQLIIEAKENENNQKKKSKKIISESESDDGRVIKWHFIVPKKYQNDVLS